MYNCSCMLFILLIQEAVKSKNYSFLRNYLTNGFSIHGKKSNGYTPLQIALKMNDITMVKFLLEHKVDPNERYRKGHWKGYTPLHYALINRNTAMSMLLIEYGADISAISPVNTPPIFVATKYNRVRVAHYLLDNGISPDTLINDKLSLLLYAVIMGNISIVKCLLKHGPNVKLHQHQRAIVAAIHTRGDHTERLVKMLYKYGFTLHRTDIDILLVQTAIEKGLCDVIVNLLKLGISPDMKIVTDIEQDISGSLLHYAIKFQKLKIAQVLLEYGANIHHRDSVGRTPILIAAKTNNLGIIRLLLKYGANVKDGDSDNNTVLHFVIREKIEHIYSHFDWSVNRAKTKLVNIFITKGADINAKTCTTNTSPLHLAAQVGVPGVIQVLLSRGARVDEVNSSDKTPLVAAKNQMINLIINQMQSLPCTELKLSTFLLLQHYVHRLHRIGLFVCPEDLMESNEETSKLISDINKIFDEEIKFIKRARIGSSYITLHRFLTCTNKEAAGFVRNDVLLKNLKAMLYRPSQFPEYAKLIRNKLTTALTKKELDRVTFKLMKFFFQEKKLPLLLDECTEHIISFLSDKDKSVVINQFVK